MAHDTVRRTEVRTADRERATAAACAVAPHRPRITLQDPAAVNFRMISTVSDGFGAHAVRIRGMTYTAEVEPHDHLVTTVLLGGRARVTVGRRVSALGVGDGLVHPTHEPYTGDLFEPDMVNLVVPSELVARIAEERTGNTDAVRFIGNRPVSDPMRRTWADTATFVCRRLTSAEELPPLVVDQLARLATSTLLSAFPNSTLTASGVPRRDWIAPVTVRRAITYMEAHPERSMSVADIAAEAGVGTRALQEAFRRHLDITPMGYLRRVRLDRAHRDLRDIDTRGGVTVEAIARRWGFAHLGRFAAEYRAVYGRLPSHTVRI